MKRILLFCCVFITLFFFQKVNAQGFVFGAKLGPSIGLQKWDNFERDPLFAFHGAAFIESYQEGNNSSLYAQLGYHVRGSATRYVGLSASQNFKFNNLALVLAARNVFSEKPKVKSYYHLGLRAEYTLNTNLSDISRCQILYPMDEFVNKFNYGFSVGAGLEFPFSEFVGGILELSVNPDISKQYDQLPVSNVLDPTCPNLGLIDIPKREIRNVTVDLSLGIRFLRKVIYID